MSAASSSCQPVGQKTARCFRDGKTRRLRSLPSMKSHLIIKTAKKNLGTAALAMQPATSLAASNSSNITTIQTDHENADYSTRTSTSTSPASTVVEQTNPDQDHDEHLNKDDDQKIDMAHFQIRLCMSAPGSPLSPTDVDTTDSPTVVESDVEEVGVNQSTLQTDPAKPLTFKFNPNAEEFVPQQHVQPAVYRRHYIPTSYALPHPQTTAGYSQTQQQNTYPSPSKYYQYERLGVPPPPKSKFATCVSPPPLPVIGTDHYGNQFVIGIAYADHSEDYSHSNSVGTYFFDGRLLLLPFAY
ncbi:hypothetical protein HDU76_013054 [Blyttiomyces sp. JEL0837]|nr:hypothetical protein HDU76_013054 [Blyttiomyces sp. JEL0837]